MISTVALSNGAPSVLSFVNTGILTSVFHCVSAVSSSANGLVGTTVKVAFAGLEICPF
ncbi:hypothetical protein D3C87_1946410 [compost metagenome]